MANCSCYFGPERGGEPRRHPARMIEPLIRPYIRHKKQLIPEFLVKNSEVVIKTGIVIMRVFFVQVQWGRYFIPQFTPLWPCYTLSWKSTWTSGPGVRIRKQSLLTGPNQLHCASHYHSCSTSRWTSSYPSWCLGQTSSPWRPWSAPACSTLWILLLPSGSTKTCAFTLSWS